MAAGIVAARYQRLTPKTKLAPLPALPAGVRAAELRERRRQAAEVVAAAGARSDCCSPTSSRLSCCSGAAGFSQPAAALRPRAAAHRRRDRLRARRRPGCRRRCTPRSCSPARLTPRSCRHKSRSRRRDQRARKRRARSRSATCSTGDAEIDEISRQGLDGLGRLLAVRTAVEPGQPVGVNILTDEIAFYPVLYWPVLADAGRCRSRHSPRSTPT